MGKRAFKRLEKEYQQLLHRWLTVDLDSSDWPAVDRAYKQKKRELEAARESR